MLYKKNLARFMQFATLSLLAFQAQAFEMKPFSASYTADWSSLPFSGSAERSLTSTGNHQWQLSFNASMMVASITEKSTFDYSSGQFRPQSYSYNRGGLGSSKKDAELSFDWKTKRIVNKSTSQPIAVPLDAKLLDKSTYQMALQADVADGHKTMTYKVLDGDKVDTYHFKVLSEEAVDTKVGKLKAIKVERIRDAKDEAKRQTTLWLAKNWNYMLIALTQEEKGGKHYRIVLEKGTVAGTPIKPVKGR